MAKKAVLVEHWQSEPEAHDFPAAADYLSLVFPTRTTTQLVRALRRATLTHRKAKDLLRASNLALLPVENVHVAKDFKKVKRGGLLSPVLVVRGDALCGAPLVIADGYHRICASYHIDENADIPCLIVDMPADR